MERNGSTTGGDDSKFEEMMQEAGLGDGFTPPQDTCAEILRRLSASSF